MHDKSPPCVPLSRFTYIICIIHILLRDYTCLDDLALAILRWDYMLTKQSMAQVWRSSQSWWCPHPERTRPSRPIPKCLIIIDLSVLIFINNCACDDPAGMLMSPQLELISCRRLSGRISIPPVLCAAVKCTIQPCAFSDGASGR